MKTKEARDLGQRIAILVEKKQIESAYSLLAPVLAERTPFAMLRHIGDAVGVGPLEPVNDFLDLIAADKTEGGWVVIASALEQQLGRDLEGAFARCRNFIIAADVWYGADTLGEGVSGRALVADFEPALALLKPWREDVNDWVRRAVGTSVHYWTKRSEGRVEFTEQAEELLALLEPTEQLRTHEETGDFFQRLALLEDTRTMPFGAVWEYHCHSSGVPGDRTWMNDVKRYETEVLSRR